MKNNIKKWFTLVELLVTITILAIISVVAYQNFGWATDKAVAWRKISDISTIETSLQQYKIDKNQYPKVDNFDDSKNKFWFKPSTTATPSNTLQVTKNWAEIASITRAAGGWEVKWINWYSNKVIWAKWTISQDTLGKQYLTKDLYDPELWDVKVWSQKAIELWIGRYVYSVYKKPLDWTTDFNAWGTAYNIAFTVKKEGTDDYITRIVWDYDSKSCFDKSADCPETLIWSGNDILKNEQKMTWASTATNQGIPYPISNF